MSRRFSDIFLYVTPVLFVHFFYMSRRFSGILFHTFGNSGVVGESHTVNMFQRNSDDFSTECQGNATVGERAVDLDARSAACLVVSTTSIAICTPDGDIYNPMYKAEDEVESVAAMMRDTKILKGDEATAQAVRQAMKDKEVLHFAMQTSDECVRKGSRQKTLNGGIVLAGGECICADEIAEMKIGAALVSALQGAGIAAECCFRWC